MALIASARPTAAFGSATQLFFADYRQYRPQVFVVSDGALVDLANLVEGPVSELDPVVADRKPSIGIVENRHIFANRRLGWLARLQDEDNFVVLQRVNVRLRVPASVRS